MLKEKRRRKSRSRGSSSGIRLRLSRSPRRPGGRMAGVKLVVDVLQSS